MFVPRKTSPHTPSQRAAGAAASANRVAPLRLAALLLLGAALVGGALALRSSRPLRDAILRGKDPGELEAEVRLHPDDPAAQYYLAKSYYLRMRFSDALPAYQA